MEPEQKQPTKRKITIDQKEKEVQNGSEEIMSPLLSLKKEELQEVTSLKLSCNSYGPEALKKVGETLKVAMNFQELDLSDCFMKRKSEAICDGIYGLFKYLPVENIKHINISNNALGTTGSRTFGTVLEKAIKLEVLLIANCGLGGIGAKEVLDKIFWCQNLQTFSIGKNRMEVQGGVALGDAIKHLPELRNLYAFQNGIKESGMHHLLFEINQHLQKLETLDISQNFIAGPSNDQFYKLLRNEKLKIKNLNISDCVNKEDMPKTIQVLTEREVPVLQRLSLNYLEIRKVAGEKLLAYLQTCPLKQLDIMQTNMPKTLRQEFKNKLQKKLEKQLVFEDEDNDVATLTNALGTMNIM